jgi:hypothetical protein
MINNEANDHSVIHTALDNSAAARLEPVVVLGVHDEGLGSLVSGLY